MPQSTAQASAASPREVVWPGYRAAAWKLERVLTTLGNECKVDFDQTCQRFAIRHTRTKPRHWWTNEFVERPQGTLPPRELASGLPPPPLTSRCQLQDSLDGFPYFYNHKCIHRGYGLKGAIAAQLFLGVVAVH